MHRMHRSMQFALAAFAFAPAAGAGVIVVDDDLAPGVVFHNIQEAVDAAHDGDVVLIRDGTYSLHFRLNGKSVSLVADSGATVTIFNFLVDNETMGPTSGHNVVEAVGAGKRVALRGLRMRGLEVVNCAGTVWIEDCEIYGTSPALRIKNSERVHLLHSAVTGSNGFTDPAGYFSAPTGDAVEVLASRAAVFDSILNGGGGASATPTILGPGFASSGGDALFADGLSTLWVEASTAQGGKGGNGGSTGVGPCSAGAPGGDGLRLESATATLRAVNALGGVGGAPPSAPCTTGGTNPGPTGQPIVQNGGTLIQLPGGPKDMTLDSPVREQGSTTLALAGDPNDVAVLLFAAAPASGSWSGMGVGMLAAPQFIALVPLGATGSVSVPIALPALPPGFDAVELFAQSAFCAAGNGCFLSAGAELAVLDSQF